MRKEFRFLLQSARINLALVAGYAAVLTLGAILFPAPEGCLLYTSPSPRDA